MCGRVAQAKNPSEYGSMLKVDFTKGIPNTPAHYNGAPGQDYLIARLQTDRDDITPRHDPVGAPAALGQRQEDGLDDEKQRDGLRVLRWLIFELPWERLLIRTRKSSNAAPHT